MFYATFIYLGLEGKIDVISHWDGITFLKMVNLVEARVLKLWRKTLCYLNMLYLNYKCTRSLLSTNILLKRVRHKPDIVIG